MDPFYSSSAWQAKRAQVKARTLRASNPLCPVCNQVMHKGQSLIVDHIVPLRKDRSLGLVDSNLRLVHHQCNSRLAVWDKNKKVAISPTGFPVGSDWS